MGLESNSNITEDLVGNLYNAVPFVPAFVDAKLNLSKFGIGVDISQNSPVASLDYALKRIMAEIKHWGKRVLVTIDEAGKTDFIIDFIQEFQILIREEMPIYLNVASTS